MLCSPKAIIDLLTLPRCKFITRLTDIVLWPLSCITDATQGYPVSTAYKLLVDTCCDYLVFSYVGLSPSRIQHPQKADCKIVSLCSHEHQAKEMILRHRRCDSWAGRRRRERWRPRALHDHRGPCRQHAPGGAHSHTPSHHRWAYVIGSMPPLHLHDVYWCLPVLPYHILGNNSSMSCTNKHCSSSFMFFRIEAFEHLVLTRNIVVSRFIFFYHPYWAKPRFRKANNKKYLGFALLSLANICRESHPRLHRGVRDTQFYAA